MLELCSVGDFYQTGMHGLLPHFYRSLYNETTLLEVALVGQCSFNPEFNLYKVIIPLNIKQLFC